jgi:hypothetical protein
MFLRSFVGTSINPPSASPTDMENAKERKKRNVGI